jgi:hypothetical protein
MRAAGGAIRPVEAPRSELARGRATALPTLLVPILRVKFSYSGSSMPVSTIGAGFSPIEGAVMDRH